VGVRILKVLPQAHDAAIAGLVKTVADVVLRDGLDGSPELTGKLERYKLR